MGDYATIEAAKRAAEAQVAAASIYADANRYGADSSAGAQRYGAASSAGAQRYGDDTSKEVNAARDASTAQLEATRQFNENNRADLASRTSLANTSMARQLSPTNALNTFGLSPRPSSSLGSGTDLFPRRPRPTVDSVGRDNVTMQEDFDAPRRFSQGTPRVPGHGDGTVDTVDAKLAPGEAVLNKAAAEMLGRGLIDLLNQHGMLQMGMPEPDADDAPQGGQQHHAAGCSNVRHYATGGIVEATGPAPVDPNAAWGNRPPPAPAPAPTNTGWADAGRINYSAPAPAPAAPPMDFGAAAASLRNSAFTLPSVVDPQRETPRTNFNPPAPLGNAAPKPAGLTFDQAFAAARKDFGGKGGEFDWTNPQTGKTGHYQTNTAKEGLQRRGLKPVGQMV